MKTIPQRIDDKKQPEPVGANPGWAYTPIGLLFDGEYTILPVANQISGTRLKEPFITLEDYTFTQIMLAEVQANSFDTTRFKNRLYINYTFEDRSKLRFLISKL